MASEALHGSPIILHTDRLILRLADPDSSDDCHRIISVYNGRGASGGGNARVGVNSIEDVRAKHRTHGPRQEFCTKAPAPRGLFFLAYLKSPSKDDLEGDLIGFIGLSFRREMPAPDIGYGLFESHWGHGYASEAGREVLRFWKEQIGVMEIIALTLEGNIRSQKTAESIGLVRAGGFDILFGAEGEDQKRMRGVAFTPPGMEWHELNVDGTKLTIRPTVGTETEEQKVSDVNHA